MGEITFKAQYVFSACPSPGIYHLIVVSYYAHVSQSFVSLVCAESKQPYQLVLRQVTILELIDMNIVPACLIFAQNFLFSPPELFGHHHTIVEINSIVDA